MATNLKLQGLHTFNNPLSEVPLGALSKADNIVIDKDSIAEPRRGMKQHATTSDLTDQLIIYKDTILSHNIDNKIQYDDNSGIMKSFSGTYQAIASDTRLKYKEGNGNLYFTTSTGIKKISISDKSQFNTTTIESAGMVEGIDFTANIDYSKNLWFTPRSKVAYRIVFGKNDNNNNLILGTPSEFLEITNYSFDTSAAVTLSITIPSEIQSTNYIYQIYR